MLQILMTKVSTVVQILLEKLLIARRNPVTFEKVLGVKFEFESLVHEYVTPHVLKLTKKSVLHQIRY